MKEAVNPPDHYNSHPSGIECIEIVRHMNFNCGNAVKYIWRADHKHQTPIEDLKKAAFYIADEIARLERLTTIPNCNDPDIMGDCMNPMKWMVNELVIAQGKPGKIFAIGATCHNVELEDGRIITVPHSEIFRVTP